MSHSLPHSPVTPSFSYHGPSTTKKPSFYSFPVPPLISQAMCLFFSSFPLDDALSKILIIFLNRPPLKARGCMSRPLFSVRISKGPYFAFLPSLPLIFYEKASPPPAKTLCRGHPPDFLSLFWCYEIEDPPSFRPPLELVVLFSFICQNCSFPPYSGRG